jgi:hypothetical protein
MTGEDCKSAGLAQADQREVGNDALGDVRLDRGIVDTL